LTLASAQAQEADSSQTPTWPAQAPKKKMPQPYGGGTPLDVILHTKLWVTPPPMAPFVKASRPPEATLDYQPTSGKETKRPALRNAAQLQQLQDELEDGGAHNETVTHAKIRHFQAVPKKVAAKKPKKRTLASSPMQITPTLVAGPRS
jgi:hypothetical protein